MIRKLLLVCFLALIPASLFAWTNCPPATLAPNPGPVAVGSGEESPCIVKANWVELGLNESWSREVQLNGGQSYWFAVSKCARAYSVAGEVRDDEGEIIESGRGSGFAFCFKAPKTGIYTVSYRVTGLNGNYSFAITNACLSESKCTP